MKKYKVWCNTSSKYEAVISSVVPSVCPVDGAHSIDSSKIFVLDPDPLVMDGTALDLILADYKQLRYNEIDYKTGTLIAPGFTYDSQQFSLSTNAQANWSGVHDNPSDFTFPLDISTTDNNTYTLAEADLNDFWNAGKTVIETHMGTGRALKKSIFDAADEAAVDAVIDNR